MLTRLRKIVTNLVVALVAVLATLWLVRAFNARSLPDLSVWHKPVLKSEFRAGDYPQGITFAQYRTLEEKLANEVHATITPVFDDPRQPRVNRYAPESVVNPANINPTWNRSNELSHDTPRGAIVLLHGASDSPYSMRGIATSFHRAGFHAVAMRLPGHGTVPGELTRTSLQDWLEISRLGMRRAREIIGADKPIYLAGYSIGGALAVRYVLDALDDSNLEMPSRVYLLSPAIGLTPAAAFAGWDVMVSRISYFEKFGWMEIRPEVEPYKYTSFPKQAGHLGHQLTSGNRDRIQALAQGDASMRVPPIMTFMSIVDTTVSVDAVVDALYNPLRSPGHALILFDVDQSSVARGFLAHDYHGIVERIREDPRRSYDLTLVTNRDDTSNEMVARSDCINERCKPYVELGISWPHDVFSMSHVAMPFPPDDPVYGARPGPDSPANFTFSTLQPRGERGILTIPTENLMRLRYNPFFDYLIDRMLATCDVCDAPEWISEKENQP